MMNLISNNPYRYLGVCSNSPARERIANVGRLKAFLNVGKEVKFPSDLDGMLPTLNRTLEEANSANSKINLPNDQLKYALFWFINVTPFDKMAMEHLWSGNVDKAVEIFGKKETFSSLINQGVISLVLQDLGKAVNCITKVIHNEEYRTQFVEAVCGNTFKISEDELASTFIDALLEENEAATLSPIFEQSGCSQCDNDILKEKSTGGLIAAINSAIENAKAVGREDAPAQLQAGKKLMTSTKQPLAALRSILGTTDMQYQIIADKLSNQILQCGINYYNNTEEDDDVSIDKAIPLQNYALKIAVGKMAKDRCKENCKILEDKKATLPPSSVSAEANAIMNKLADYVKKPNKISYSVALIQDTTPHLQSMKGKLGSTDAYYLKMSSLVVNAALHNLIEEVNSAQSDPLIEAKANLGMLTSADLETIKEPIRKAWKAICMLDDFDKDTSCKSRFNTNKSSLRSLCTSLNISTYTGSTSSSSSRTYSSSTSSSSSSRSSSSSSSDFDEILPILKWVVGIIIFIIICANACS